MIASPWDQRIDRARQLVQAHAAAREILRFYVDIAGLQKSIYERLDPTIPRGTEVLLPYFPSLLSLVAHTGPAPVARTAGELAKNPAQWPTLLADPHADEHRGFFTRVLLQPYFEYQARGSGVVKSAVQPVCPFCGERPQVAVLRGEGEGGKRSLVCSLCATEWEFRRLLCPNCGEEAERKLPVFVAEEFPHVRIEACDTCRTYIKAVDLTRNGLAVPIVDELASVALNVWADERGYAKRQLNLLGM